MIYGKGKTVQQIKGIVENMLSHHQTDILITRVDEEKYQELKQFFPRFIYDEMSKIFYCGGEKSLNKGKIAVSQNIIQINDVGVAGLHRLLHRIDDIQQAQVIVVVAGMEGALASVVGGLVSSPIIAVPTSVGYGANFQGLSALLSMLNSCASGVSVVNIDNGFGAGYMAHSINCIGGKR